MNATEYMARQTVQIAKSLIHFLQTTESVRLNWKLELSAGNSTRSALEQAAECVEVNRLISSLLKGEPAALRGDLTLTDAEEAENLLLESAQALAAAISSMSDADLDKEYQHPRAIIRGENLIMMAYRNMAYHAGQINFIQTLAGDTEFHAPPNWR